MENAIPQRLRISQSQAQAVSGFCRANRAGKEEWLRAQRRPRFGRESDRRGQQKDLWAGKVCSIRPRGSENTPAVRQSPLRARCPARARFFAEADFASPGKSRWAGAEPRRGKRSFAF